MVGTLARIRPSSVMLVPSSGTLRSDADQDPPAADVAQSSMLHVDPLSYRLAPTWVIRSARRLE